MVVAIVVSVVSPGDISYCLCHLLFTEVFPHVFSARKWTFRGGSTQHGKINNNRDVYNTVISE
jgi:hypothetical protein